MDYKRRIDEIIRRAERIAAPIQALCEAGGVSAATFYRWRQPEANPRIRSMLAALEAMEAELTRRELKLIAELQGQP